MDVSVYSQLALTLINQSNMISFNKIIFLSILLFCLNSCETNKEIIIDDVVENYNNHHSISYDVNYTMKFFSSNEPSSIKSPVIIQRDKDDPIFGGKFLFELSGKKGDSLIHIVKYYDLKNIFIIRENLRLISQYNNPKKEKFAIEGNVTGDIIKTYFLQPNKLKNKVEDEENVVTYSDSANFVKVEIKYVDKSETYDNKETFYINKSKKTIKRITSQGKYKDQVQKKEWDISNIVFDSVNDSTFQNKVEKYFIDYKIKDYKPLTKEDYKLIENGKTAPLLNGYIFPDYSKKVEIKTNKITILDFWYTSCMPCIKAIPHLNKIKEKYGNQIQIIGINDKENKPSQKDKIEAFLKRTPIDYKILLVDEIPKEYNIRAYPTLYIIGKDNKVKYSRTGNSDNLFQELDQEISKLIEN